MSPRRVFVYCLYAAGVTGAFLLVTAEMALAHNCQNFSDCFASADAATDSLLGMTFLGMLSMGLDFVPYVGTAKGVVEAVTGRDLLTGEELSDAERLLGLIPGGLGTGADILSSGLRHTDDLAAGSRHTDDIPTPPPSAGRGGGGRPPNEPPAPPRTPDAPEPPRRGTQPSRDPSPDNTPRGTPDPIARNADADEVRALTKQNEAADVLSQHGYDVEHVRKVPGQRTPDYLIEGQRFDHKAPVTDNVRNFADRLSESATTGQADRFVVNLDRLTPDRPHPMDLDALRTQLSNPEYNHIKEIIVLRDGEVIRFWP